MAGSWQSDPTLRHRERYHDDDGWSDLVREGGAERWVDPYAPEVDEERHGPNRRARIFLQVLLWSIGIVVLFFVAAMAGMSAGFAGEDPSGRVGAVLALGVIVLGLISAVIAYAGRDD